jgi:hypothetical protein
MAKQASISFRDGLGQINAPVHFFKFIDRIHNNSS